MTSSRSGRKTSDGPTRSSGPLEFTLTFNRKDYVVGRVLGTASLYFRAATAANGEAARGAFERWAGALGASKCSWWQRSDTPDWKGVDARTLTTIGTYLQRVAKETRRVRVVDLDPPERDADHVLSHARAKDLEFCVYPRGGYLFSNNASFLRAMVPRKELIADAARWRKLVLSTCEDLPVSCGVVGFALSEGGLRKKDKSVDRAMDAVLERYRAVEVEEDLSGLLVRPDRIRGVGWLTILGADAQKSLGGAAKIKASLKGDATLHETAHALVIQAGPRPVLGDDPASLEPYRAVYRVVKPLLAPVIASLNPQGKALFARLA